MSSDLAALIILSREQGWSRCLTSEVRQKSSDLAALIILRREQGWNRS